jgi:L-malate glycosyltransferase
MTVQIIHIDTAKTWRGGQQQAAYLHRGLIQRGIESLMVCPPGSAMENWCRENQLPVQTLSLRCEADFLSAIRLAHKIRNKKSTILHAHNAHALMIALIADFFSGKKSPVVASRRVDFSLKEKRYAQWKYRTSRLSRIICISHKILRVLRTHGIPEEKLTVISSGVDMQKFDKILKSSVIRDEFVIPQNHRIVCTVAALTGEKGYPTFLEAAERVIRVYPDVTFVAVGEGKKADMIHKLAMEKQLSEHVRFTGFRKDIGSFLKNSDIFVMASKREGLGTSILDAEAAGLPVIGTDAGGIPEVIRHEENGLIVPRQNPEALAKAIITLLKNDDLRKQYGEKSLEVVKAFTIEKTIEKHVVLYEEIFKKN